MVTAVSATSVGCPPVDTRSATRVRTAGSRTGRTPIRASRTLSGHSLWPRSDSRRGWTSPERAKVQLADYMRLWIAQRAGLRPRTVDIYSWLLRRYIAPRLGAVPLGKLTTPMIREWRAGLLADGVSDSMGAKSYRLLRAVLTTAVEEDKIIPRNPCKIRGAGEEHAPERPVLTVAQVFDLADRVGRRPVGNIRKLNSGGYRLRFGRNGVMRTLPENFRQRGDAERALWADGRERSRRLQL
jgi:hypothetical protein